MFLSILQKGMQKEPLAMRLKVKVSLPAIKVELVHKGFKTILNEKLMAYVGLEIAMFFAWIGDIADYWSTKCKQTFVIPCCAQVSKMFMLPFSLYLHQVMMQAWQTRIPCGTVVPFWSIFRNSVLLLLFLLVSLHSKRKVAR